MKNSSILCSIALLLLLSGMTGCRQDQGANMEEKSNEGGRDIHSFSEYARAKLPDSLVVVVKGITEVAAASGEYEDYGTGSLILANREARNGNWQEAVGIMEDFLRRTTTSTTDSTVLCRSHYRIGEFYYISGIAWMALDHFLEAAQYTTSDKECCRLYYAIAITSSNSHEASRGIAPMEYYEKSVAIAHRTNDSVMISHNLFGMSQYWFDALSAHQFKDEPLSTAKKDSIETSIRLLKEADTFQPDDSPIHYGLGLAYAALKEFGQAQEYIGRGVSNDIPGSFVALNVQSSLLICMGRYTEAIDLAKRAFQTSSLAGNEGDMRNASHILYYAYKYAGDTSKALATFEEFSELKQRLMDKSFEQQVNIAQVSYDTKLKEEQLAHARERNVLYRQGLWIIFSALVVAAILLTLVLIYNHRLRGTYRSLVAKSQRWAEQPVSATCETICRDDASDDTNEDQTRLSHALAKLLLEEKLYLQSELKIETLAHQLGTNRTYLSQAINKSCRTNFTTYINTYRIQEAIRILSNPLNDFMTVDSVAAAAGFSNRFTFTRAFNNIVGLSPTQFRRNR